ncbi:phosphotriesterase family protein [Echinicola salinicaeni]|uniref:phosphotriesterase family protein n=1 Tax=Echinicola salinicaeni TaxID=2762757 RepID=UPI001C980F54|nr:phosphotriesterase [Echinicola salinicaeni]
MKKVKFSIGCLLIATCFIMVKCTEKYPEYFVQTVNGTLDIDTSMVWLSHEHLLVDFIGADSIRKDDWDFAEVVQTMLPYLEALKLYEVSFFVDPTPNYLGRDPALLKELSKQSGINIITNTGLYGAVDNKYLPGFAFELSAKELAEKWIEEYINGIDATGVKPGFIKISVDNMDPLETIDEKLVEAAALTHLRTGLTIASHTGPAKALWPQLEILRKNKVSPTAFVWVHAQGESDMKEFLKAAESGCWISLDGLGWEMEKHLEKVIFAKENGFLDQVLISHDAGWFDPQKDEQGIVAYTRIFKAFVPQLKSAGFTQREIDLLLKVNPAKAFGIKVRELQKADLFAHYKLISTFVHAHYIKQERF